MIFSTRKAWKVRTDRARRLGASHDYFLPYRMPLARHYQLIFFDERGSGHWQKLEDVSD